MMRWLRRLFWLGVLAGAGCAAYRVVARRRSSTTDTPSWPPSAATPPSTPRPSASPSSTADAAQAAARWVAPSNGDCPSGFPIKANDSSGIYHVPGGRFYARTAANRCYGSADDAVADGYRPAKA